MTTEARTHTIAGPFDRARLKSLTDTLSSPEVAELDPHAIIKWEGRDLVIRFGQYLAQHVENELSKQENAGL